MTRADVPAASISMLAHAVVLLALIYAAMHPSDLAVTRIQSMAPVRFIFAPSPGSGSQGGARQTAAAPRLARGPESQRVDTKAPDKISNVQPLPIASVPAIATDAVVTVPGALTPFDGSSPARGSGPGSGTGHGPGNGPGEGTGDVYEPGNGGVSEPKLIYEVKPNFTVDAMRAKIQGVVVMDIVVLADGTVDPSRIRITHSLEPGLDRQAVIAVKQWRFRPSVRLGQAVAARATVELTFTLR